MSDKKNLDLIDRKSALEAICMYCCAGEYDDCPEGRCVDYRLIEDLPKADALEVVHGRWVDEFGGKYDNQKYICSICKLRALDKWVQSPLGNWHSVQALTDYCPNCGAKMDGERRDGE